MLSLPPKAIYLLHIIVISNICEMADGQTITEDSFGDFNDPQDNKTYAVRRFTMKDERNVTVQIINFGGTITSLKIPNKNGVFDDIVLGFDTTSGYWDSLNPYFGATVGRVANRIGNGTFTIDGIPYKLAQNDGNNSLHGGLRGFNRVMWDAEIKGNDRLVMTYNSPDGEEGYPGDVKAEVTFVLLTNGPNTTQLVITHKATSTKKTPVNLVNHSYFNLAGHKAGKNGLYEHNIRINADEITEFDGNSLPTGKILNVKDTEFDLRFVKNLGEAIKKTKNDGFDINYCIIHGTVGSYQRDTASVIHEKSGRYMEISTDQPGVQFYTHNNNNEIPGKENFVYKRHGAFCLETQNYPDAINHETFPNSILEPGKLYSHTSVYLFGVTY